MNILLSNDDGIDAPGLVALEAAVSELATCWVVAPETEQSANSHALTMHKPLRARSVRERAWAVSGTPADCVYLAIHHLLPEHPTLVLSGINRGGNLGNDVFYSGTVAAAMEAVFQGVPSVALSLYLRSGDTEQHWDTAGQVARRIALSLFERPLPPNVLLNVNIPNVPHANLRGLASVAMGQRHYLPGVDHRMDPRGKHYFWIGGAHDSFAEIPDTDGPTIEEGWATITPCRPDLTDRSVMQRLRDWTDR